MTVSNPSLALAVLISIFLLAASTATPARWKKNLIYPDATNFTLLGNAAVENRVIRLTRDVGGAGAALYFRPIRFLEPAARSPASFSTRFTFSIDPSPSFGDGIAFLITSRPRSLGRGADGYMGLFDRDAQSGCGSETATVAVEFDTKLDAVLRDINDNHVGIDVCSIVSVASADAGRVGVNLTRGTPMKAWIDYSSDTKMIKVWVGYTGFRPLDPVLVANVDLNRAFRDSMYIGFSASNCNDGCRALHTVSRWRFSTSFASYSSPVSARAPSSRARALWVSLGIGGAVVFVVLTAAAIAVAYRSKDNKDSGGPDPPVARISLDAIKTATDGFDSSKILARSGSATTYAGVLPSGCKVIVKRFGRIEHFTNVLATELAVSRHPNLVPFKGWCCERDEMLIVHEFAANGSLRDALHAASADFPWDIRYKIVLGVAAALAFLHEECETKVVHRNVTTRNVLLDEDYNARLGGLAKTNRGAAEYLAPEYAHAGMASEKTDVYGFGVVALEVVTGRKPVERGVVLVDWVWGLWGRNRLIEAADRRLRSEFDRDGMVRLLTVGLSCTHPDCGQRPSVRKAIQMLEGTAPLPVLPARKPAVRLVSSLPRDSDTTSASVSEWLTPCVSFSQVN